MFEKLTKLSEDLLDKKIDQSEYIQEVRKILADVDVYDTNDSREIDWLAAGIFEKCMQWKSFNRFAARVGLPTMDFK